MRRALIILLLLCGVALADEMTLRIIQVMHQPPEALVDSVRPFLSPGGVVVPNPGNGTLLVRDYPKNLDQIEQVVHQLDVVAPEVRVQVQMDALDNAAQRGVGLFPGPPNTVVIGAADTRTRASNRSTLSLLLISGSSGTIRLIDHSPQFAWFAGYAANLGYVPAGIVFTDVGTGVQVTPRVVGQNVLLTIAPWIAYQSPAGSGTVAFREAATEVQVHDGDTVPISVGSSTSSQLINFIVGQASQSAAAHITMTVTPQIVP
ncbi:MAG: secretin N-terminal domain-containing protein [Candidatus Xenobia bacterium]